MRICLKSSHLLRGLLLTTVSGLAVSLTFCACSAKVKSAAIGTWRGEEGKDTMEFRSDGTLRGIDRYGRAMTGNFEFVDAEHVRMKTTVSAVDGQTWNKLVDSAEGICKIQVQGDVLTLVEPAGGAAVHYRKAK